MTRTLHALRPQPAYAIAGAARRVLAVIALAAIAAAGLASGARGQAWPAPSLPEGARSFDIGATISVNGLPLRVQGFVSAARPDEIARWFRRSLGEPLLESRFDRNLVLGRLHGEHYLTVQLEAAGSGTRGLVGITHLKAAFNGQRENQADVTRWLARWPAGSRMLSQVVSRDTGRMSQYTVIVNAHGHEVNVERVKSLLAEDGFAFELDAAPAELGAAESPANLAGSRVLFFKGAGKEAIATIHRDAAGRTAIVLNTIDWMERSR